MNLLRLIAFLLLLANSSFAAGIPFAAGSGGLGDAAGYPAIFDKGNAVAVFKNGGLLLGRSISLGTPYAITLGAAATTFAPGELGSVALTGDAGGNTIATINGEFTQDNGQLLVTFASLGGGITFTDDATPGSDTLALNGDFVATADSSLLLQYTGDYWFELSRSGDTYVGLNSIDELSDVDTTTDAPNTLELLHWNGTNWVPAPVGVSASGAVTGVAAFTASGLNSSQYFRATETTADTNPVKYGWVSPDATLYGLDLRGDSGTRPYSAAIITEGAVRAWWNYQGSNYVFGPQRFTGQHHTASKVGISSQTLDGDTDTVYAVIDSDYTLPAINKGGIYQGDGDGDPVSRVYTIVRGNTTNPVALIATGDDVIEVQGSEETAGVVTYSWISAASIDFTKKGAGVRCHETYYRVSTGPDVFKAAWMCASLGFGIEVSP